MANIILRTVKENDLQSIGRCFANKTIPCKSSSLKDYLKKNMTTEVALAIAEEGSEKFLGLIEGLLVDDMMLTSYFISPYYQETGICTKALGLFINYIRKNNPEVKKIKVSIDNSNKSAIRVVEKNKFKKENENEFVQEWEIVL